CRTTTTAAAFTRFSLPGSESALGLLRIPSRKWNKGMGFLKQGGIYRESSPRVQEKLRRDYQKDRRSTQHGKTNLSRLCSAGASGENGRFQSGRYRKESLLLLSSLYRRRLPRSAGISWNRSRGLPQRKSDFEKILAQPRGADAVAFWQSRKEYPHHYPAPGPRSFPVAIRNR